MARGYPDYEGDKSGLYLKSEWAAMEGLDKNFSATADTIGRGGGISAGGIVGVEKKWIINEVSGSCVSWLAVDGELNQMCFLTVSVAGVAVFKIGGNGGVYAPFGKPLAVTEGQLFGVALTNMANHDCSLFVSAHGYEVDA